MTDDAIRDHEKKFHPYDQEAIAKWVSEHEAMQELVPDLKYMVKDLYGKRDPKPGDRDHREGGRLVEYDQAVAKINNGGVTVDVPWWAKAVLTGTFLLLATIAGALITSLLT